VKEHWQVYKSLATDLRKRAKWEHVEEPRQKRFLEMAEFIETQPKFYVPDMSYVAWKESQEVGTHNGNLIRLPYPKTVVLMDENMTHPDLSEAQHSDYRAKDLMRYNSDEDCMNYFKKTMEAQDKLSHRPTVVLAEQCEGIDDIEVMIGTWNALNKEWNPYAIKALMVPDDYGYKLMFASKDLATNLHIARLQGLMKDAYVLEVLQDQFKSLTISLVFLHMLLSLENVKVEKRGAPKLSVVGTRSQKKKHKSRKSFDYHVLSINGETWDSPYENVGGGHGGVRSHLRRGHIRRLSNGKTTWVRAAFIRGSKEGFVNKDYDILGGDNANKETRL
tara:strand:- start:34 stop:1032 length:999 start_codon:yes stop_codon:yes gene_type:complete